MILMYLLIAAAIVGGLWLISGVFLRDDTSFDGASRLRRYGSWQKEQSDLWSIPLIGKLNDFAQRFVFLDQSSCELLERQLARAGLAVTPKAFTARKYLIIAVGGLAAAACALLEFWLGVIVCALLLLHGTMRQRDALYAKLKAKDEAIALEMPRFVRTICRNLRGNRDIYAALSSYRKVSGDALGAELDILLVQMRSGNIQNALNQFQTRLGTEEVFRLCSTLNEIDRGIDQTATLDYLADDMARQAKYRIQKQFALRPARMRRTYYPAVGICVAMILYVLIVFVVDQLGNMI